MKYGESAFDILYLLFAVLSGCVLLIKAKNRTEKLTGAAALTLGVGDAFHLVPRVLNYFSGADFTSALGIGKLVTSVTMTFFYLMLYYIWLERFEEKNGPGLKLSVWLLSAVRIILCLFPQNGWISNSSVLEWSIARNVPFVILGALICFLFFKTQKKTLSGNRSGHISSSRFSSTFLLPPESDSFRFS